MPAGGVSGGSGALHLRRRSVTGRPGDRELRLGLRRGGGEVLYQDPHVPHFPAMRRHDLRLTELRSEPLSADLLRQQDCTLVVTHHAAIDWALVAEHAPLVVDTRNVVPRGGPGEGRVVPA